MNGNCTFIFCKSPRCRPNSPPRCSGNSILSYKSSHVIGCYTYITK